MTRYKFIENVIKRVLDYKEHLILSFKGDKEKIKFWLESNIEIMQKKMQQGFEVPLEIYLTDFYAYKMICEKWQIVDLVVELLYSTNTSQIEKHVNEIEHENVKAKLLELIKKHLIE